MIDGAQDEEGKSDAEQIYGTDASARLTYEIPLQDSLNRLQDARGLSDEEKETELLSIARFSREAGINSIPAATLHSLLVHHLQEPATPEQVQEWTVTSRRLLREKYGVAEGEARMSALRDLLKKHPGVGKQLAESGVGSHPDVVLALAESYGVGR